jgi:hypothetical protein
MSALIEKYSQLSKYYKDGILEFSTASFPIFQQIVEQKNISLINEYSESLLWIPFPLSSTNEISFHQQLQIIIEFSNITKLSLDFSLSSLSSSSSQDLLKEFYLVFQYFLQLDHLDLYKLEGLTNEIFYQIIHHLHQRSHRGGSIFPISSLILPQDFNKCSNQIFVILHEKLEHSLTNLHIGSSEIYSNRKEVDSFLQRIAANEYYLLAQKLENGHDEGKQVKTTAGGQYEQDQEDDSDDQYRISKPETTDSNQDRPSLITAVTSSSPVPMDSQQQQQLHHPPLQRRETKSIMKEVARLYQQAAELGHAGAQCELGILYGIGSGILKDEKLEVYWHRKGAEQGNKDCLIFMGNHYKCGKDLLPRDYTQAIHYYTLAEHTQGIEDVQRLIEEEKNDKAMRERPEKRFTEVRPIKKLDLHKPSNAVARSPRSSDRKMILSGNSGSSSSSSSSSPSTSIVQFAENTIRSIIDSSPLLSNNRKRLTSGSSGNGSVSGNRNRTTSNDSVAGSDDGLKIDKPGTSSTERVSSPRSTSDSSVCIIC